MPSDSGDLNVADVDDGDNVGTPATDTLTVFSYDGTDSETISVSVSGANDTIIGGYGADTLYGGGGNDTFSFLSERDTGDVIILIPADFVL